MAAIKVSVSQKEKLFVFGIYRPPSAHLDDTLSLLANALEEIPSTNCGIFIFGDINVNSLSVSREKTAVVELLASFNIKRVPLPPTRITTTSATSIDIVCTDLDLDRIEVEVLHTGLSDHTGQSCSVKIDRNLKKPETLTRRNLSPDNLSNLVDLLTQQTWWGVYSAHRAEEAYANFIGTFTATLDIACPLKKTRNKKRKHNYQVVSNPEAVELRNSFLKAQYKYLQSAKEEDKAIASQRKKDYDVMLKNLRKEANEQHISGSSNKSKAIWDIIRDERMSKRKVSDTIWQINSTGMAIEDLEVIAEHFNHYFINVAEETLSRNNTIRIQSTEEKKVDFAPQLTEFRPTTSEEILNIITSLKPKTSTGLDGISSKLLKHCKYEVSRPISDITNKSMSQGVFPAELKISKVCPLYKQGSKNELQNFRPISLLPVVSKVIEKVILTRLLEHLEQNNLVPQRQHSFLSGKSTTSALVDIMEHLSDNLEEGNTIQSIFIDLSKAFDCLDHKLILSKINSLGITGIALKWFASYLQRRKQVVELKQVENGATRTATSTEMEVRRGVPQGSVLGPVLFVLFTRDLQDHLEEYCYPVSYADDTVLITASKSVEELEIRTANSISMAKRYFLSNDLVFNPSKTKCLSLGRHKSEVLGPPDLEKVVTTKHLGITVDNCLSWNCHLDVLCAKLSTALFVLKRIKSIGTPMATKTAYYALFEAHIRYGIILWGGSSMGNLRRVLLLQKRAVRIMADLTPRESCREAFKTLGILTVVSLYITEVILHASKTMLVRNGQIHEYQTRRANDFNLPAHRTTLYTKKPSFAGAKLYNVLPEDLKNCSSQVLKRELTTWLRDRSIYSIEEFKMAVN